MASVSFQDVSEGESYRIDYVGYHALPEFPARPGTNFPWLCYYERASQVIQVDSGAVNMVTMAPELAPHTCTFLGGDRYVVNPNYTADAQDSRYGSLDGENVLVLFIHDLAPNVEGEGKACDTSIDPSCTAPFGVFATLPDGVYTPWPSHHSHDWERELAVMTDGSGDALVYLVVKPGEAPQLWEIEVKYPAGTTPRSESFRVRLSNGNRVEVRG